MHLSTMLSSSQPWLFRAPEKLWKTDLYLIVRSPWNIKGLEQYCHSLSGFSLSGTSCKREDGGAVPSKETCWRTLLCKIPQSHFTERTGSLGDFSPGTSHTASLLCEPGLGLVSHGELVIPVLTLQGCSPGTAKVRGLWGQSTVYRVQNREEGERRGR